MCRHISLFVLLWRLGTALLPKVIEDVNPLLRSQPKLECLADGMRLHLNPAGAFGGHVYVKGYYHTPRNCHLNYCHNPVATPFYIHIPYKGDCLVTTQRVANPSGVNYQVAIVVQHHPYFVTAGDRAYRLNCFYEEHHVKLEQKVDVKEIHPTNLDGHSDAKCRYDVLKGSLDGPRIQLANVGDPIVHKWTCDSSSTGFLVHSCVVKDQSGRDYALVDERGCSIDRALVRPLAYADDMSTVSTTISAFRFADQLMVHFSCQLTLCEREENGCEGIVPPACDPIPLSTPFKEAFRRPKDPPASAFSDDDKMPMESDIATTTTTTTLRAVTTSAEATDDVQWSDTENQDEPAPALIPNDEHFRTSIKPASQYSPPSKPKCTPELEQEQQSADVTPTTAEPQSAETLESKDIFPTPSTVSAFAASSTMPSSAATEFYSDYFTTLRVPTGFRYFVPARSLSHEAPRDPFGMDSNGFTTPAPNAASRELPIRIDPKVLRRLIEAEKSRRDNDENDNEPQVYRTAPIAVQNVNGGFELRGDDQRLRRIEAFTYYRTARRTRAVPWDSLLNEYESVGSNASIITTTIRARGISHVHGAMVRDITGFGQPLRQARAPKKAVNVTLDVFSQQLLVLSSDEGFHELQDAETLKIQPLPAQECPQVVALQCLATFLFSILQIATLSIIYSLRRRNHSLQAELSKLSAHP